MKRTNRELVMDMLVDNQDKYISGENISENLHISRASVWKHINSLKKEGYKIESKSGTGYRLIGKICNKITSYDIKKDLNTGFIGQYVEYFDTIDSTNSYGNKYAKNLPEGAVILAGEQSEGRGRFGKHWISKADEGIYLSIILKPNIPLISAGFLTQVVGGALAEAFEEMEVPVKIKWPNDIILNGRKICGILTEMNAEIDKISYIIVGIGINISAKEFDEEIEKKATSLLFEGYNIEKTVFLKKFFEIFEKRYIEFINGDTKKILDILREKSAVLKREVYLVDIKTKEKVYVESIDEKGNLVVVKADGKKEIVYTGEISIRGIDSYI